jgi:hypothetical protein
MYQVIVVNSIEYLVKENENTAVVYQKVKKDFKYVCTLEIPDSTATHYIANWLLNCTKSENI